MRFCARVQGDLNQAGSRRIGRCEDASARGIADLRGTATVEATDRSASDGRAFAPQAVAPMRRTRHFWQTRQRSHRGRFDVQAFPVRKFSRDDPIATFRSTSISRAATGSAALAALDEPTSSQSLRLYYLFINRGSQVWLIGYRWFMGSSRAGRARPGLWRSHCHQGNRRGDTGCSSRGEIQQYRRSG